MSIMSFSFFYIFFIFLFPFSSYYFSIFFSFPFPSLLIIYSSHFIHSPPIPTGQHHPRLRQSLSLQPHLPSPPFFLPWSSHRAPPPELHRAVPHAPPLRAAGRRGLATARRSNLGREQPGPAPTSCCSSSSSFLFSAVVRLVVLAASSLYPTVGSAQPRTSSSSTVRRRRPGLLCPVARPAGLHRVAPPPRPSPPCVVPRRAPQRNCARERVFRLIWGRNCSGRPFGTTSCKFI
jgi:hypothetical protein